MKFKIPFLILIILITVVVYFFDGYRTLGRFYFYVLLIWGVTDLIIKRKIELIHIWNASFGFIILSEVFSDLFFVSERHIEALQFLITANNLVLLGYISKSYKKIKLLQPRFESLNKTNKTFPILLLVLTIAFVYFKMNTVLSAVLGGRLSETGEGSFIFGNVVNALGFILPAVTAYYIVLIKKKSVLLALLLSFPVLIIQFLIGTRFPLLFSVIGFMIIIFARYPLQKLNFKQLLLGSLVALLLLFGSNAMKNFRAQGFTQSEIQLFDSNSKNGFAEIILNFGSSEGVIDMTSLMFDYFDHNEHLYGESSSFLLYFWIPREIWPDKPTMLGHWFIREYRSGFSEGHSASFGFSGDLYADFGWFSLIPIFFIGRLLKVGENFKSKMLLSKQYQMVLGAMLFPYVFFFVRSPITSTINFLAILFFYYLFKRLMLSKKLK